jgi:hypothetical protein
MRKVESTRQATTDSDCEAVLDRERAIGLAGSKVIALDHVSLKRLLGRRSHLFGGLY